MKLYTEEQVKESLMKHQNSSMFLSDDQIDYLISEITPIELPTDEEMDEYVYDNITPPSLDKGDGVEQMYFDTGFYAGFRAFAKWMRDKIQGGNQ